MRGEKTAAKIADKYRENVEKGVESPLREIDSLLSILAKYQNKSGTISKSKTRSKKAQKIVKETIKELNKKYGTKKARNARREKIAEQIEGAAERLETNKVLGLSGDKGIAAAQVFVQYTSQVLPKHFMSEIILALADSDFSGDDIMHILDFLQSTMNSQVPDEMDKFTDEDDVSLFVSNLSNLRAKYPTLSLEDSIEIADKYMQGYGFDDVDDAVERWKEDNQDEDEEEEEDEY